MADLYTLAEWKKLTPYQRGYVSYWQACLPQSRIPDKCPFAAGSTEEKAFAAGSFAAMLAAQDSEE